MLETTISGLREDMRELTAEIGRTRRRLHELEAVTGGLVTTNAEKLRQDDRASRRLEMRLHVLTIVVAVAGVLVPLVIALAVPHR